MSGTSTIKNINSEVIEDVGGHSHERDIHKEEDEATGKHFSIDDVDLPEGYFKSLYFWGSMVSIGLSVACGVAGFSLVAPILSLINADIGPSPDIIWVALSYTLTGSVGLMLVGRLTGIPLVMRTTWLPNKLIIHRYLWPSMVLRHRQRTGTGRFHRWCCRPKCSQPHRRRNTYRIGVVCSALLQLRHRRARPVEVSLHGKRVCLCLASPSKWFWICHVLFVCVSDQSRLERRVLLAGWA